MICSKGDKVSSGKMTLYALVGISVDVYALIGISVRSELRRSGSLCSEKVLSAEKQRKSRTTVLKEKRRNSNQQKNLRRLNVLFSEKVKS